MNITNIKNSTNIKDIKNIFPFEKIYFIGIGGISMSGICEILLCEKIFEILGSDINKTEITKRLENKGVKINYGQIAENINKDIGLIVYTAAIKKDNKELEKAKKLGIKTMERAEFLGKMMLAYKYPICIAGTHGKTTTTSIITEVFLKTDKEPTISLGGNLPSINSNFKVGKKDYLILETCEYCDTFLKFNPHSAIILNIDEDHLDYFNTLEQIYTSFGKFAGMVKKDGVLVINSDIKDYHKITKDLKCNVITYGKNNKSNWKAKNISFNKNGFASYDAYYDEKFMFEINLSVVGLHNVYNSLAVCAMSTFYGVCEEIIVNAIKTFCGVCRRFEYKGTYKGATIIDDYAHHPTEIEATIEATKNKEINNLWCVFQPHTYTRTKALLNEFANSLKNVSNVIVTDIYSAREKDTGVVHSKELVDEINKLSGNAIYLQSFGDIAKYLKYNIKENDMIITMGAGDVHKVYNELVNLE